MTPPNNNFITAWTVTDPIIKLNTQHVEYFVLSTHTALFLPQSYLMHPTLVFNFFPNDKPNKIGQYKYGERLFKCDLLSQSSMAD